MVNFGVLSAEIVSLVWGTPANFNGFRVLPALLRGTLVVGVSQTLRRWTEGATCIRQGGHHVGHWPTFSSSFYLLSSIFFSSPHLNRRRLVVYHTSFDTWRGLSANLGCRSETWCTRLTENTRCKRSPKNRHLRTIVQFCWAISSQLRHVSTIKKTC